MKDKVDALLRRMPGIKAREIARLTGIPRGEINALVHNNPTQYQQDESFGWTLVDPESASLTLPGSKWVTAEAFEVALSSAGPLLDSDVGCVNIYIPQECSLMIDCTSRLLCLANQLVAAGKEVKIDFTQCEGTSSYLDRAGFFDQLSPEVVVLPSRPVLSAASKYQGMSETLVEFGTVDPGSDNQQLIEDLATKFVRHSSNEYQVAAFTIFGELIGNVAEHSGSPLRGIAGLQRYNGRRSHVQSVVSDSGLGIAETLRPALSNYYPDLFKKFGGKSVELDLGLVREVVGKGNISRLGKGRGLGFKSSKEQALKYYGSFSVRQDRFCLKFEYRNGELMRCTSQTDVGLLLGTHICFDFYIA